MIPRWAGGTYSWRCPEVDVQSPGDSFLHHCCPHSRSVGYRPVNQDTSIARWCRWICTLKKHNIKHAVVNASLMLFSCYFSFPICVPWWSGHSVYLESPGNRTQTGTLSVRAQGHSGPAIPHSSHASDPQNSNMMCPASHDYETLPLLEKNPWWFSPPPRMRELVQQQPRRQQDSGAQAGQKESHTFYFQLVTGCCEALGKTFNLTGVRSSHA